MSELMDKYKDKLACSLANKSRFEKIGTEIGKLVDEKNRCYGDAFNKSEAFLRLLYPEGIKVEQYGDVLALVRVFDKQVRIATNNDSMGENPWRDIGGYSILMSEGKE